MAYDGQIIRGWFKRWAQGAALCRIPLWDTLTKIQNILETLRGINGIRINKPQGYNGEGWTVELEAEIPTITPRLWDTKYENEKYYLYCGDASTPWFISHDGETEYCHSGASVGWVEVTAGTWYARIDDTLSPSLTYTDDGDYEDSEYCYKVAVAGGGVITSLASGAFHLPITPGDSTHTALVWNATTDQWEKGTFPTELPTGDATNVALKWDSVTDLEWKKAAPIQSTNDLQSGELAEGDAVVIGASIGTDGSLIRLTTKNLGSMGGLATGDLTQVTYVTKIRYDSSSHKLQKKTQTGYVYSPGTESDWADWDEGATVVQYDD